MLSAECLQFSLGAPVVSAKALFELRDLLASLNLHGDSGELLSMQILRRESMKRPAKPLFPQMNLALGNVLATGNLDSQQKDLIVALMELLVSAAAAEAEAEERNEQPGNGGEDES